MIDLIVILGSVLLILVTGRLIAKFQVKRFTQNTTNLQKNLQKKTMVRVKRLKKIEDLTKQKLLTISYIEQIAKLISDGLIVANREKILYVNPAIAKMTGYSVEELTNKPWASLIPKEFVLPDESIFYDNENNEVEIDGVFHFLNHWLCKDGRIITLRWTATPFDENGIYCAICRNVSCNNGKKQKIYKLTNQLIDSNYVEVAGIILDKAENEENSAIRSKK